MKGLYTEERFHQNNNLEFTSEATTFLVRVSNHAYIVSVRLYELVCFFFIWKLSRFLALLGLPYFVELGVTHLFSLYLKRMDELHVQ